MSDDLRPRGTVELTCPKCLWATWYDPLHPAVLDPLLIEKACTVCHPELAPTRKYNE